MRTWHMVVAWTDFDPATSADPDEGEAREEHLAVEAESLEGAIAAVRLVHPSPWKIIDLESVNWEPWPGLVYQINDAHDWQTIPESPWTSCGSILLRDAAPLPEGLERESVRIDAGQVDRLIAGTRKDPHGASGGVRCTGWRISEGGWLVHPSAVTLCVEAKSLGDDHAACLTHPRVRSIVSGPHKYAPILGLDEHGEVVCVTIGRKR